MNLILTIYKLLKLFFVVQLHFYFEAALAQKKGILYGASHLPENLISFWKISRLYKSFELSQQLIWRPKIKVDQWTSFLATS